MDPGCSYCTKMERSACGPCGMNANDMWETNAVYNPTLEKIADIKARVARSRLTAFPAVGRC